MHVFNAQPLVTALSATSLLLLAASTSAQINDPLPANIDADRGLIVVTFEEFASLPEVDGEAARPMLLVDEPRTQRLFVNDMTGPLYTIDYAGNDVTLYLDINAPEWGVGVQSGGRERGFQSFALHPDFGRAGAPGYGHFYTWSDVVDTEPEPDFVPDGGVNTHDTVLHQWVASDPSAPTYDGSAPVELMRFEQPFANHNGGLLAFNPLAGQGDDDYGMLYIGSADGGSGGDPLNLALNLGSNYGKLLRIDPLGDNSDNGRYGIPADNPFVNEDDVRPEIYAYGMRNPQRFGWDPDNGNLFLADIGQNMVEKISLVPRGGNLGWRDWEGSFRFIGQGQITTDNPRHDTEVVYPVAEYTRFDPLMQSRAAVTGVVVYREGDIDAMRDRVFFGDFVTGEILHFDADNLPGGGNEGISRLLLDDGSGEPKTLLQLVQEKNAEQGRNPADRTDLRFGTGPDNQVFILNKHDGVIRRLTSG